MNTSSTFNVTTNAANGTGSIGREYWLGVTGNSVTNIPVNTAPSGSSVRTSFQAPINFAESFSARIRGFIVPSVSGSYTFSIAKDNNVELWLSTDSDPANKVKIGFVTNLTAINAWNTYSTQTYGAISLTAGQQYHVEVLQKEITGSDHVSVDWTGPGIATRVVVPGTNLAILR